MGWFKIKIMLELLNTEELRNISGGHDGTAYEIGKAIGDGIKRGAIIFGVVVAFFAPKS